MTSAFRILSLTCILAAPAGWGQASHPPDPLRDEILARPPGPLPDRRFSFSDPAGPRFSEDEKARQREAGKSVLPMVRAAFDKGESVARIPPGDYRFGAETWDKDGVVYALEFKGLKRPPERPFTIDATGATFWFDLPDDQAPHAHYCVGFKECEHLVFRGATLDRGTCGHVEGRIAEIDFEGNRLAIDLSPGLTVPTTFNDKLEQRLLPFKADGTFCAPLYALQPGGVHMKYKRIDPDTRPGRWWITMNDRALLDTLRDESWRKTCGDRGLIGPGDGISCVYTVSCAIELEWCAHLVMDGLRIFVAKGWGAEWGGEGGHLWKDCYIGPRPGTSQWQGGEGFMFCATRIGTTLDNVTIRHTTDDVANFHGYWGHVEKIEGDRITLAKSDEFRRTVRRDLRPGDHLRLRDKDTGEVKGEFTVGKVEETTVTVDREAGGMENVLVEWPDHACAGWSVRRCHFEDNYQRLLIQSGPGRVEDCVFLRQGCGIELNSDLPYVEGGVPQGIAIVGNRFEDVNPRPQGAAVHLHGHTYAGKVPPMRDITIKGNTFLRSGDPPVQLPGIDVRVE